MKKGKISKYDGLLIAGFLSALLGIYSSFSVEGSSIALLFVYLGLATVLITINVADY